MLEKETYDYYYTSNTFVLDDSLLQPGVLSALKAAQPGLMKSRSILAFRTIKCFRSPSLSGASTISTLRINVWLDNANEISSRAFSMVGGGGPVSWAEARKGPCECFIQRMSLRRSESAPEDDGALLQFLETLVLEVKKRMWISCSPCRTCRKRLLFLRLTSALAGN